MDEKPIEKKQQEQPVVEKKIYTPPTVTVFGKLAELTAGGSGRSDEGSDHTDPNKHP